MRHPNWHWPAGALALASLAMALAAASAMAAAPTRPAFKAEGNEYRFDTGELRGTLRAGGRSLGLQPVLAGKSATPVAGPLGLLSPYRLLAADARFGSAAWDWASKAKLLDDGAVEVRWSPDDKHPLEITAVYRWAAAGTLDFEATVKPRRKLRRFELFLASYFRGFPASYVYARRGAGGKPAFVEATKAAGHWQAFPRDDAAAKLIADGRWKRPPHPVAWKIMPHLAAPLAVRRDAKSDLAAVLMAGAEDCFAISTPFGEEGHRSVYLSLFGRDIEAGETASARARLVIGRGISDEQAVALHRAYVREQARPAAGKSAGAWPFFALCMDTHDAKRRSLAQQAKMLKELGYDGAGHLWPGNVAERIKTLDAAKLKLFQVYVRLNVAPGAKQPYDARIKGILPLLKGRGAMLAVLAGGRKASDPAGDERAVALLRELADLAKPHGVRLALYPHVGDWVEKVSDAIRVARKVDRPNVGAMFNLCHFLKVDDEKTIEPLLKDAGALLMAVTINGGDRGADIRAGKGKWIVPLDEGSFDMAGLLATLRRVGYKGPVGLQCYGIGGDARVHLARSIAAWRKLNAGRKDK